MARARKIMVLGAIGVGKTSLSNRLAFDRFEGAYKATIGVDIYTTNVEVAGEVTPLVLWDTDGDFGLTIFKTVYLKGAGGAVVVGDVTRAASLEQMERLIAGFRDAMPGRPCAALFNKSDLLGRPAPELASFGREADFALFTSAATGEGVRPAFGNLVAIVQRRGL